MKFKIIVDVRPNPDDKDLLDVTVSRTGRVARVDGSIAAALQFAVTQTVSDVMVRLGAKNNGKKD